MSKECKHIIIWIDLMLLTACKHPYDSPAIPVNARPLVVEGFINSGVDEITTIKLSRVQDLSHSDSILPESNAVIFIESKNNESFPLYEDSSGTYKSYALNLILNAQYRLNISTSDGNNYLSDFVKAKKTPPIDSLEWNQNSDVTIYVNTHDPIDNTRYYRWEYSESWNYRSAYSSLWTVRNRVIYFKDSLSQTDSCWRSSNSTEIVTANSVSLNKDVIRHYPIYTIPVNSEKISNRYSILVKQFALDSLAYDFYQILKKNTQQVGTLFDPQPSKLPTNIHCLTHSGDLVIGFVSATTQEEKRMFINNSEVHWDYSGVVPDCSTIKVNANFPDSSLFLYPDTTYTPYYFFRDPPIVGPLYIYIIRKACTECTYYGGTNVKPSFW
jgi:hypothetical protein